jgi:hypothetical protein
MKPSFFALFKRGRYYRPQPRSNDSEESKSERKEKERFARAAIAFCIEHCPDFGRLFWDTICRDAAKVEAGAVSAEIEPQQWADLLLTNETGEWESGVCGGVQDRRALGAQTRPTEAGVPSS